MNKLIDKAVIFIKYLVAIIFMLCPVSGFADASEYFSGFTSSGTVFLYMEYRDWDQSLFGAGVTEGPNGWRVDGHVKYKATGNGQATIVESTGSYANYPGYTVGTVVSISSINPTGTVVSNVERGSSSGIDYFLSTQLTAPIITSPQAFTKNAGATLSYTISAVSSNIPITSYWAYLLPDFLTYNETNHTVSGVIPNPYDSDWFEFYVGASNNAFSSTQVVHVTVTHPVIITSPASVSAKAGEPFEYQITAEGDPTITYSLPSHPSYLSLDSSNHKVSGTIPWNSTNTFSFTVAAQNSHNSDSQIVTVNVAPYDKAQITSGDAAIERLVTSSETTYPNIYTITATGLPTIYYGACWLDGTALSGGWTYDDTTHSVSAPAQNPDGDASATFKVYVSNPVPGVAMTDHKNITAKFIGNRCDLSGYIVGETTINPKNLTVKTETVQFVLDIGHPRISGTASLNVSGNGEVALYRDVELTQKINSNSLSISVGSTDTGNPLHALVAPNGNGTVTLYAKPLAPNSVTATLTFNEGSVANLSSAVNLAIDLRPNITEHLDNGPSIPEEANQNANPPVLGEDNPDSLVASFGNYIKLELDPSGIKSGTLQLSFNPSGKVKVYSDLDKTNEVGENYSITLDPDNPTGVTTVYAFPQTKAEEGVTATLTHTESGKDDKACFKIKPVKADIAEYKSESEFVPEEGHGTPDESNPNSLIVPTSDDKSAHYVKVVLNTGDFTKGTATLTVQPAAGNRSNRKIVEVYTDPQLTSLLKDKSADLGLANSATTASPYVNDLAGLKLRGAVTLYIKTLAQCDDVVAKISITGEQGDSSDEAHFKICNSCPCTACAPGDNQSSLSSSGGSYKAGLGTDFGSPAGAIFVNYPGSDIGDNSAALVQFALTNSTVAYSASSIADETPINKFDISAGIPYYSSADPTATINPITICTDSTRVLVNTSNNVTTLTFFHKNENPSEATPFRSIAISVIGAAMNRSVSIVNTLNSKDAGGNITSNSNITTFSKSDNTFKLIENGIDKRLAIVTSDNSRTETYTVRTEGGSAIDYQTVTTYANLGHGEVITQESVGSEITTYEYYASIDSVNAGRLKKVTYPKGNSEEYTYDSVGNIAAISVVEGNNTFIDTYTITDILRIWNWQMDGNNISQVNTIAVIESSPLASYRNIPDVASHPADLLMPVGRKVTVVRTSDGVTLSRSENTSYDDYSYASNQNIVYDGATQHITATAYVSDKTKWYYGQPNLVRKADGTIETYAYSESDNPRIVTIRSGAPNTAGTDVVNGTQIVTATNGSGGIISQITSEIISGNLGKTLASQTTAEAEFDEFGRATKMHYLDGSASEFRYGCCGIEWEKDREGIETVYVYDLAKRLESSTRNGIKTAYTYNANGDTLTVKTTGRDGGILTSSSTYDNGGRQLSSKNPMNNSITYVWGNTETTTFPDGSTKIVTYSLGAMASITGTAVHPVQYEYGVDDGKLYTKTIQGSSSQKMLTDMLGRTVKVVYADASYGTTEYNINGQPVKQVTPGGMILLSQYDSLGRMIKSAIDMNRNGSIEAGDIYADYLYEYTSRDGKDVSRKTTIVCNDSNTTVITEQSLDGLDSWTTVNGRTTHTSIVYPPVRNGSKTISEMRHDGSSVKTTYRNGLPTKTEVFNTDGSAGNILDYTYDQFDHVATITEKFGSQTINATAYTYNANGQKTNVTLNGRTSAYVYDNMDRQTQVTYPGGRSVNYEYFPTGEMKKVYGAETYTQAFTYTDLGSMASLTAYKDANTPEVTAWTYNNRNFMTAKTYADNNSTAYVYDADGRLTKRTWARLNHDNGPLFTTYSYDNAGRRIGIAYNDNSSFGSYIYKVTPGVILAYDYLNRLTSVTDGAGTHTFTYNTDSTLASETVPHIVNGLLEYAYDSLGRKTGMTLNQNSTTVFTNNYTYDVQNRITTVSDGTNTATYSRVGGTNLLNTTTITAGGNTKLTTTRSYDSLYRMTGISSATGAVTKSYSYTYDDKDRRSRLDMADGSYWTYSYDDNGQVVGGIKYDSTGKAVPGQHFGYDYDGIGNLTAERRGFTDLNSGYTSNSVNQYTQRTIPGIVPIIGEADTDVAVKILRTDISSSSDSLLIPARDGKYFSGMFNIVNTPVITTGERITDSPPAPHLESFEFDSTPAVRNVTYDVYAIKDAANQQLLNKKSGSYLLAESPQAFTYDADGNMLKLLTQDGGIWSLAWDTENRLVDMSAQYRPAFSDTLSPASPRLEFSYDFMGRRIKKRTYTLDNHTYSESKHLKFVYNGYKLIAEYDGTTGALLRRYCWNGDNLEWMMNGSTVYYYVIDGNKNVTALIDSSGNIAAEYSYDPFGRITAQSGPMADINPFRFSSEYYDSETGLVYYNFRYYSPDLRRWLSRDSMEEMGGVNLYCFVNNNPFKYYDYLGKDKVFIDPEGRITIDGPFSDWLSDAVFGSSGRRSPNNDYEKFLVYYRQNKSKFHYDSEYFNHDAVGQRHDPTAFNWIANIFSSTEDHDFLLEDPTWLKLFKGTMGTVGKTQSQREFEEMIASLTDIPGYDQQTLLLWIKHGKRPLTTIDFTPPNSRNENMSRISGLINMVKDGVDAAKQNDAVLIKTSKCGDSIRWVAGLRDGPDIKFSESEFEARNIINMQYYYYNISTREQLPYPFGDESIPKFLKY